MSRFLRAGRNVVSTSLNQLVNPKTAAAELREPLEEACRAGGTSFFNNGADPGFGSDLIPLTLLSLMDDIESVRVQEIVNYSHYDQAWVMRDLFGFGQPLDYQSPLFTSGALTEYWGGVVTMIADALGLELDEIREVHEFAARRHRRRRRDRPHRRGHDRRHPLRGGRASSTASRSSSSSTTRASTTTPRRTGRSAAAATTATAS